MAEMTAAAMVEWLTSDKAFGAECYSRKQIAALIQQQAATITELQTEIAYQNKQIARLQEDLIKQVKEGQNDV